MSQELNARPTPFVSSFTGVSYICPFCQMICGWNAKQQVFDAVQIGVTAEREDWLQYAHRVCVAKAEARD